MATTDLGPARARLSRSAPTSWRPLVLRMHFYAGILVAPFILIATITGGLYAAAPTVEKVVYHDILTVDPVGEPVTLAQQVDAARSAFPQLTVSGLRPAATPTESTRVYLTDPTLGEDKSRAVFVNPYSATVLGDETTWLGYLPPSTWLDGLHRHLQLGEPGRLYSELAASWLWVVALGGLYLWFVKSRKERVRGTRGRPLSSRGRTLNWHGKTGVWLLVTLLFLSATGITWSTYAGANVTDVRAAFGWERPELNIGLSDSAGPPPAVDVDGVVAAAERAGVGAPLELTLPTRAGQGVTVTEIDKAYRSTTDSASIDPVTLNVTDRVDYARDYSFVAKLADWGIRLHMGFLFGLLNQLLLLVAALGLVTVIVRGYLMWWQRRPTRGGNWAVGRPPMRGGVRRLAAVWALVTTALVIGVGYFLPLLGLSVAGFLLVDAGMGLGTRIRARSAVE